MFLDITLDIASNPPFAVDIDAPKTPINRAIPIATKQAESWYKDASKKELDELKNKKITKHEKDDSANPELNNKDVHVYYEDNKWKIKTDGAK